jgi:hypothetical protein
VSISIKNGEITYSLKKTETRSVADIVSVYEVAIDFFYEVDSDPFYIIEFKDSYWLLGRDEAIGAVIRILPEFKQCGVSVKRVTTGLGLYIRWQRFPYFLGLPKDAIFSGKLNHKRLTLSSLP